MIKSDVTCVIDDDEMFTYVITKQMKLVDFCNVLLVFKNGLEAVNYIKPMLEMPDQLPDIILLDLNMPVMDGWQFLDEFTQLQIPKKITIYIVSSSISEEDHSKAKNYSQVSNFYVKPISRQHLIEMITKAA